jgi:hypothetical protein
VNQMRIKFGAVMIVSILMLQVATAAIPAIAVRVGVSVLMEAGEMTIEELTVSARNREDAISLQKYSGTEYNQHHLLDVDGSKLFLGWDVKLWNYKDGRLNKASHQSELTTLSELEMKSDFEKCEGEGDPERADRRSQTHRKDVGASGLMHASSPILSDQYELGNRVYGGYWHGYSSLLNTYGCVVEGWNDFNIEGGAVVNQFTAANLSNEECVSFENSDEKDASLAWQDYDCESMFFFSDRARKNWESKMPSIGFLQGCVASDGNYDYLFGGLTVNGYFRNKLVIVNRTTSNFTTHDIPSSNLFGHTCVVNNGELTSYGGFSTCDSPDIPVFEELGFVDINQVTEPMGKCIGWIDENFATEGVNKLWTGDDAGTSEYFQFPEDVECAKHYNLNLTNYHLTSSEPSDSTNCLAMRTGIFMNGTLALFGGIDNFGQTENRVDLIIVANQSWTNSFDMHIQRIQPLVQIYDNGSFSITGGNSGTLLSGSLYESIEWLGSDGRVIITIIKESSLNETPFLPSSLLFAAIFVAFLRQNNTAIDRKKSV